MGFCPGAGVLLGAALLPPAHSTLINSFNPSKLQNSGPKVPFFGPSTQISLCCLQSPGRGGGRRRPFQHKASPSSLRKSRPIACQLFFGGVCRSWKHHGRTQPHCYCPVLWRWVLSNRWQDCSIKWGFANPPGSLADLTQAASSQIFIKRAP